MKNFVTLYYGGLVNSLLTKDVGLIPFYIHKEFGYNSYIVTPDKNQQYSDTREGVSIITVKGRNIGLLHFGLIKYLVKSSNKIDVLNLYHFYPWSLFYGCIYKLFNRKGKIYLKLDQDIERFKKNGNRIYNINKFIDPILKIFENLLIKICDIISIEQFEGLELFRKYNKRFFGKLKYIPNGADDYLLNTFEGSPKKENIIIHVGRIGTPQKNTEMLLKVLEKIKFTGSGGRKCYIIGPIEKEFENNIKTFYNTNPQLKNKVYFTGPLNKQDVYDYYSRAKIFLLTSMREGFPLVYPEALFFGNHIITTKVSGAKDITKDGLYGDIVKINDVTKFTEILQKYIDDTTLLNKKCKMAKELSKKFLRSNIITKLQW